MLNDILVLTQNRETEAALAGALGCGAELPPGLVCRDLAALKRLLDEKPAQLVLADVDPEPEANLDRLTPLINTFKEALFLILCSEPGHNVLIKAMQAGVRHVQAKSGIAAEMQAVLRQFHANGAWGRMSEEGRVVTVLQASGGCGSTTLAVNLANELNLAGNAPVLLIDMDYAFGAVATYLDVAGKYGLDDVLSHGTDIDSHLVSSTSVRCAEGFDVLLSPASTNFNGTQPIATRHLGPLISAARGAYTYTIMDAPRLPLLDVSQLAFTSDLVLVVLQPLVKDIRTAKLLCAGLLAQDVPESKIRVALNRYHRRQPVPLVEITTALRGFTVTTLSNDFASVSGGLNYGKPLSAYSKRSALRKDILTLIESLPVPAKRSRE